MAQKLNLRFNCCHHQNHHALESYLGTVAQKAKITAYQLLGYFCAVARGGGNERKRYLLDAQAPYSRTEGNLQTFGL